MAIPLRQKRRLKWITAEILQMQWIYVNSSWHGPMNQVNEGPAILWFSLTMDKAGLVCLCIMCECVCKWKFECVYVSVSIFLSHIKRHFTVFPLYDHKQTHTATRICFLFSLFLSWPNGFLHTCFLFIGRLILLSSHFVAQVLEISLVFSEIYCHLFSYLYYKQTVKIRT